MSLKGYASQLKIGDYHLQEFATVEPIRDEQHALSVNAHLFVRLVGTDAAEAASAIRDIKATGHAARKGDVIRVTSGTYSGFETRVQKVTTDNIYLVDALTLANTDTFQIYRQKYPTVDSTGKVETTATLVPAPIIYDLNGVDTEVLMDTGTPANSRPLPIQYLNSIGVRTDIATQTTLAALLTELQLKADLTETQPVSAASLPLPTGAATDAKLDTLIAKDFATQTTLAALLTELQLKADLTETQPVSAASLPLPTGASTSANQTTEITHLSQIEAATEAIQSNNFTQLAALLTELQLKADLTENQPVINKTSGGTSITGETIGSNHAMHQKPLGLAYKDSGRLTSSVTTGAWTEIIASTAAEGQAITINENAGVSVELGIGAAASEARVLLIPPGGMNGIIPLRIPASSRVSLRAVSGTAAYTSTVEFLMNILG